MGNFMSSESEKKKEEDSEPESKSEPEPESEPEERLSENGNKSCQGYLVTHCNLSKYPPNPQNSMDNPNIAKCNQRFVPVSKTESTTGYLQCKLSKDGNTCNMWNDIDKSDKVKCDLEVDGLPYCESDILYGPGTSSFVGKSPLFQKLEAPKLNALVKAQKGKCRCEDGKSVKGETQTIKLVNSIKMPTYNWYCG